jgi:recombination endonuclease VII
LNYIAWTCPYGHAKTGAGRKRKLASGEVRQYPICLICLRDRKRRYAEKHPDRIKSSNRSTKMKFHYGMSAEDYEALAVIQGGCCAVCQAEPGDLPLYVDHNHITHDVRGLLCRKCNFAIGLLDDSPARTEVLARYLRGDGFVRLISRKEFPVTITIENTTKRVVLKTPTGEVEARIWEGTTESGIPVHCYITRVAVANTEDHEQFEKELQECRAPSVDVAAIPTRMIL